MEIQKMQKIVDDWVKTNTAGYWQPNNMMLRLMEEVGELAREVNHQFGEKPKKPFEEENRLEYEIADILFALVCIANSLDIDLDQAFQQTMEKYTKRDGERFR